MTTMPSEAPDVLLTVKEYADVFRRHPQTIYRAIYRNRLKHPVERVTGRSVLIRVPRALLARIRERAA